MIDLPKRVAENIDRFTGRTWLLPVLLDWWGKTDERLFLLTGGPGTGKSMILGWLAGSGPEPEEQAAQAQLVALRSVAKAAHFCQASSRNITPQAFAESIANQLTRNVQGFSDALAATLADRVQVIADVKVDKAEHTTVTGNSIGRIDLAGLGDEFGFDQAFTRPLKKLYASGYTEPLLLLVDALDEAFGYTGDKTLPALLASLVDLPAQVRILATTREDPRVLDLYDGIEPFDLDKALSNMDDVHVYAAQRLGQSLALGDPRRKAFAQRLATQAQGVFLYAAMVLDEVLPKLPEIPDLEIYPLPDGLSGLYRVFLKRELGTEDKGRRWHRIYKSLLGLIAVAQGEGLTATQLGGLIGEDIAEPLDACKQYLSGEMPEGPFRHFHKSFTDFLIEDKTNIRFHVDAQAMHRHIADYLWKSYHSDWSRCDAYALDSLAVHLHEGELYDRLRALISPEWMQERLAGTLGSSEGFIADLELAWRAASREGEDAENAIVQAIRYSLIRTSFNSAWSNYPPRLAARALEEGIWTPQRVLSLAARARGPAAIALWAAVLATDALPEQDLAQAQALALRAAQATPSAVQRASGLRTLAKVLRGNAIAEAIGQCVDATKQIENPRARVDAIIDLAPLLNGEEKTTALLDALEWIEKIRFSFEPTDDPSWAIADALARLAPLLSQDMALRALEIADKVSDPAQRATANLALAPRLPESVQESITRKLHDEMTRALEIARSQQSAIAQGREIAREAAQRGSPPGGDGTEILNPRLLVLLGKRLTSSEKDRLYGNFLSLVSVADPKSVRYVLPEIASDLSPELASRAVSLGSFIQDPADRSKFFALLSPALSAEDKERLLIESVQSLRAPDPLMRAVGLAPWVRNTEGEVRQLFAQQALAAARALGPHSFNGIVLAELKSVLETILPELSGDDMESVLGLALLPNLGAFREELLELAAPKLKGEQLRRALKELGEIDDQRARGLAVGAIARQMAGEGKRQAVTYALSMASKVEIPYYRIKTVAELIDLLDGADKEAALSQSLELVSVGFPFPVLALEKLAPHLTDEQIDRGLEVARQLSDGLLQKEALVAEGLAIMIPRLSGDLKRDTVDEVLTSVERSDHSDLWGSVLERLIPSLDGEPLRRSWMEARRLAAGERKARSLLEIARTVDERDRALALDEGLSAARSIPMPSGRVAMLVTVGKEFPEPMRDAVFQEARTIASAIPAEYGDDGERAAAVAALSEVFDGEARRAAQQSAMDLARASAPWRRAEVLDRLIPSLEGELLDEALRMAEAIADEGWRGKALAAAAARLAQETDDDHGKREALSRIGGWLWSLRNLPRGRMLYVCTQALFEQKILSQHALEQLADSIREIGDEWRFGLA